MKKEEKEALINSFIGEENIGILSDFVIDSLNILERDQSVKNTVLSTLKKLK